MEKEFNYNLVPLRFMHCIHDTCVKANQCVRYKAAQHATSDTTAFSVLNPCCITGNGEDCRHFFADKKARFAVGITHLFDAIPHKIAQEIDRKLYSYFGRNTYYRIRNKERYIHPTEVKYIRQLFLNQKIDEEPAFDAYVEQYEW